MHKPPPQRIGLFCLVFVVLLAGAAFAVDLEDTRLLSDPAVSDDHVAFAYARDLWIAGREGGGARRLTSDIGRELSPRFSPDGEWLAFSAEYDGNTDVFVVPTAGGVPTRLTWHPGTDLVQDWSPEGDKILFASQREVFTNRYFQLFEVPKNGGFPLRLPIPNGFRATYSPDGSKIAYIPVPERFGQWKNYRGGTASRIWIYDRGDHSVQEVPQPEGRCNDTDPTWIGTTLYFRSDRNGELNLFSFDSERSQVTQHTRFDDFPIERVTSSADTLILEQAGYLHLFDPQAGSATRLRISVPADLLETRARWVDGPEWIRSANLSPSAARAVFEYRGEILTLPRKKGDARNLTRSTAVHERSPVWSPDGKSIAYLSDQSGEYKLHIAPQDGRGDVRTLELEGHGFYFDLRWSPDGGKISYTDNSKSLYWIDVDSGKSTLIASEPHYRPGLGGPEHSWSPDSRWLAYSLHTPASIRQIWAYGIEDQKSSAITDGLSEASEPVFDKSGKYLYFLASTDAGPAKNWFAMSNSDTRPSAAIYLAVLPNDEASPLNPESDEEADDEASDQDSASGTEANADKSAEAKESDSTDESQPEPVRIDFPGISQRILALPVATGALFDLDAGEPNKLFFRRRAANGDDTELILYDLEEREETKLLDDADGYALSGDGKSLLYVANQVWGVGGTSGAINVGESQLATDKLEVKIDPPAEWRQIFHEAWRINRDYFYDPNMHGADWEAMGEKYSPLLDHVATRDDLNRVMRWMSSELAVGHHRNGGGDERLESDRVPGGLLGADYSIEGNRYRFAKVYGGLNWNPDLRAPLTEPGVSVAAGEYLLAVNGVDLFANENLFGRFENTAGKIVELLVGPNSNGSDARQVQVVPIGSEIQLRNRDWVESNLRKVDQATGGRVAYVYVPNTAGLGHTYFKRYFFPQVHKEAIIVDERFNGGGQVADYYIDHLRRPYISHWATRYGKDLVTPSAAIFGPKVMLIDETAGSGGDLLPWMFRKLELGTLIGKRTWGGLVGTLGFPILLDGGSITAPNLAIWTNDGFIVENVGVPPDIEVEQWPAEIAAGHDPQLEKAIEVVLEQLESSPPERHTKPDYPIRATGGQRR